MGTRGLCGFVADGILKVTYNHSDSYPEGLGQNVLEWLRENKRSKKRILEIMDQVKSLKVVDDGNLPTQEEIQKLLPYSNMSVGNQQSNDWYCLLRETQGNLAKILECGYILDSKDFAKDSLFCEWGYVVDLDRMVLEVYKGFQKECHIDGRFALLKSQGEYYPIRLIAVYSFDNLPKKFDTEEIEFWTLEEKEV